jgi:hypothetical protein
VTASPRYLPPRPVTIACWAFGAVVAVFGLWLWLGMPAMAWYEGFLLRPNMWLLVLMFGGAVFGMPLYGILTLRGRLRQIS